MFKVGIGYDIHGFQEGGPLTLGGVTIPYGRRLKGHSDADALLHAITDALLGAAALPDIGRQFPDTDVRYKGASSALLLAEVRAMVEAEGYVIRNCDAIVITQGPRLAPAVDRIRENVAEILGLRISDVGLKAKTNEGFGYIGEGEALAVWATVLVERREGDG